LQTRIICIGSRLKIEDAAALYVYDILAAQTLPPNVSLIEGGLAGLNLLCLLENGGRIIFIDTIKGFTEPGRTIILTADEISAQLPTTHYDHTAALPYLLTILPKVSTGKIPEEILLLGIEDYSHCSDFNLTEISERAARAALSLAAKGSSDG